MYSAYTLGVLLLAVAFFSGCGGADKPPSNDEETEKKSLTIVSSFPSDGAENIPVQLSRISVTPSSPLDVSSLNGASVHLMPGDGSVVHNSQNAPEPTPESSNSETHEVEIQADVIPGQIHYDNNTGTLHFIPDQFLNHGTTYHLRLQNIKLANGEKLETGADTLQFTFTTKHLIEDHRIYYRKDLENGGVIPYRRHEYQYDVNSNKKTKTLIYDQSNVVKQTIAYDVPLPGGNIANMVFYSADNEIVSYNRDIRDEFGIVIAHGYYRDAGLDGVWGNDNDLLSAYTENNHQHNEHSIFIRHAIKPELVQQGVSALLWEDRNDNFRLTTFMLTEHDGPVFQHRVIVYRSLGLNGELDFDDFGSPKPLDDVVAYWLKRDFDPTTGLRIHAWHYYGNIDRKTKEIDPVRDSVLFSNENEAISLTYYQYKTLETNPNVKLVDTITYYSSPGDDENWLSYDDNTAELKIYYEYDANGVRTKRIRNKVDKDGSETLFEERIYRTL